MHQAPIAGRLGIAKGTAFEAPLRVSQQLMAVRAQRCAPALYRRMLRLTIHVQHRRNRLEFPGPADEALIGAELDHLHRKVSQANLTISAQTTHRNKRRTKPLPWRNARCVPMKEPATLAPAMITAAKGR